MRYLHLRPETTIVVVHRDENYSTMEWFTFVSAGHPAGMLKIAYDLLREEWAPYVWSYDRQRESWTQYGTDQLLQLIELLNDPDIIRVDGPPQSTAWYDRKVRHDSI